MAKLNRVTGKLFGETASSTDDPILGPEIGQFGSAKAGTFLGTGDIATIQNLPAWSNGWIDTVTPTNQYPALPERTGVDKVLSYQENYILQRGIPEWDASTDYYINCFCSYNGKIYISLTDENLNNKPDESINNWSEYDSGDSGNYANQDLNNLTSFGNARLQYAPFSINAGTVNEDGYNATLHLPPGTSVEADWVQPKMTSMGTWGGDSFAIKYTDGGSVARGQIWNWFDGDAETYCELVNIQAPSIYLYFPEPICPTSFTYMALHNASLGYPPTQCTVYGSNDENTWEQLGQTPFNEHIGDYNTNGCTFSTQNHYQYLKLTFTADWALSQYETSIREINISGKVIASATSSIICEPCFLTTCDGRTVQVENQVTQDFETFPNSEYRLFRDINTGFLTPVDSFVISKTLPINADIVGRLTNNNGVLSGFSANSYAQIVQQVPLASANSFEFVFKFNYGTSTSIQSIFAERNVAYFSQISISASGELYCQLSNNHSSVNIGSGTGSTTLTSGNAYYVKLSFDGSVYKVYLSSTGEFSGEESEEISITSSAKLLNYNWNIGCSALSSYEQPFNQGSIDLKESYINIDGQRWWSGESKLWLDISTTPANLKVDGVINNDLVYIGNCTINNGIITALHNRYFNACPYRRDLVDSYQNGASKYAVYSDGWCEQEGVYNKTASGQSTINLLKNYINGQYQVLLTPQFSSNLTNMTALYSKATSSFIVIGENHSSNYYEQWQARGYIEKINLFKV